MVYNRSLSFKGREDETAIIAVKQAAAIVLIIFCVVGLIFNSIVLHSFRCTRKLHTPCNFLAVGHILCDLLVLISMPFEIVSNFYGEWIFGPHWCQGHGFIVTLLWVSSVCIYTAIAFERYLVVTLAEFAKKITMFKACMTLLSCFGYGLMWAAFPLVGWGNYIVDAAGTSCSLEWDKEVDSQYSYGLTLLILVLIFPLSAMAFCYIRFMMQVSKNSVSPLNGNNTLAIHIQAIRSKEIQVSYAAFIAIFAFVVGMTPYWITAVWSIFNNMSNLNTMVAVAAPVLAKSTSVSGPIIYVVRNKDFRIAVKKVLFRRCLTQLPASET